MTHNFDPLPRVVEHCRATLGMSWQEVEAELERGHNAPALMQPGKRRIVGEHIEAIAVDGDPMLVLYVRPRRRPEPGEVVPAQVPRQRGLPRSKGGGSGRRWATTFGELIRLAERNPGVRIVKGAKHYLVLKNGQQVCSLPVSASDHRSLMNASKQLDNLGINVRRSA